MDIQDKIEKYILNRLTEAERADFEIEMRHNPLLKEQVELEKAIVSQIRVTAFVDEQIKQAKEELRQEKFEDYLLDRMTGPEKAEFENELENNPLLKEQLELEQDIVGQIRNRAFVDKQIATAKKEMQRGEIIRLISYSVTSIAALFLVFFLVHGVWQGKQCDKLYASNYSTHNNDYILLDVTLQEGQGVRGEADVDSITAMTLYEKKDYKAAENQFDQILSVSENLEIRFYLAISQLENGKTKEAIITLETLYAQPTSFRYYEQTRWYLALANLKLHNRANAKRYLKELVDLNGVSFGKANGLLEKL